MRWCFITISTEGAQASKSVKAAAQA